MWWLHFGWRLRQEGSCEFKAVSELCSEFQTSLYYRVEPHLSKPTNKSNNDNKIPPKVKFKSVLDNTQGVTKETSAKKIKKVEERRLYLWRRQEKDPKDIWETLRQSLWGLWLPARHRGTSFAVPCHPWTLLPEFQCSVFQHSQCPFAPTVTHVGPRTGQLSFWKWNQ